MSNENKAKKTNSKASSEKAVNLKKLFIRMVLIVIAIAIVFAGIAAFITKSNLSPICPEADSVNLKTEYVKIPSGMSVKEIGQLLEEKGFIKSSKLFYYVARFPKIFLGKNPPVMFKSGVYEFSNSMSMTEIVNTMADGNQAFIKTSIPEGLTIKKIAKILEKNGVCKASDFIEATEKEELLKKLGIEIKNCEGFLFPDTYFFYPDMNADEVVSTMIENFFTNLKKISGQEQAESIDYNTLILASIIEREYRVDEEAPLIASVFNNRIKIGMGLESCATIEYIITEIQNKPHPDVITYEDLKINSLYNTYKWAALPPGPISNPGMVALSAALNPAETDYYFFTLTDQAAGSHTFSKTLKSHAKATAEFRTKKAN